MPGRVISIWPCITWIYVLPPLVIVLTFVRTMGLRKLSEREGACRSRFPG
ncbi:MAG: hypothetical protein IPJ50_23040 [Betaproteobacteria bacterium]|nr:hypothetical protein [Betaproteobacteria bacterium]